jgi:hypothetical protein
VAGDVIVAVVRGVHRMRTARGLHSSHFRPVLAHLEGRAAPKPPHARPLPGRRRRPGRRHRCLPALRARARSNRLLFIRATQSPAALAAFVADSVALTEQLTKEAGDGEPDHADADEYGVAVRPTLSVCEGEE